MHLNMSHINRVFVLQCADCLIVYGTRQLLRTLEALLFHDANVAYHVDLCASPPS
jgi:hypothetical protein